VSALRDLALGFAASFLVLSPLLLIVGIALLVEGSG
jgi:hypothetical protein